MDRCHNLRRSDYDDGVYGYVPLTVVDAIIAKHGGILLNEQ